MRAPLDGGVDVLARSLAGDENILATGPLTNLAHALARTPESRSTCIAMGGAFGRPGGNISAFAEFNFWADPAAVARVLGSGLRLLLVPLDVTERVIITARDVRAFDRSRSDAATFAADLLEASIENHKRELGLDGCYMHDATAAMLMLDPTLATWEQLHVGIVCDGPLAGHLAWTATARSGLRAVDVALRVDADKVRDMIIERLAAL